jgi:zinc transport system substrate-binding protein
MEPHDWEPNPRDVIALENADLFVYNGAGLEFWSESVLSTINNEKLISVVASKEVDLLDTNGPDPHVWLNPLNAKKEALAILNALLEVDPDHSEGYQENYNELAAQLDSLDKEFRQALEPLPKREVVVTHPAFAYLCEAYSLTQVGIQGLDAEADSHRMAEIIQLCQSRDVRVIFAENPQDSVARVIANAISGSVVTLSALEGLNAQQVASRADYFSVMRENLSALTGALR